MRLYIVGGISLAIATMTSCKHANQTAVKHDFEQIADAGDLIIDCDPAKTLTLPQDQEFLAYLSDQIKRLIAANRNVLPAKIENVCMVISPSYEINASAEVSGLITANRGILWAAKSDAQIAAVFAHELAHAASIHGIAPNQSQGLAQNQEYLGVCKRMRQVYQGISSNSRSDLDRINREFDAYLGSSIPNTDEAVNAVRKYEAMIMPLVMRMVTKYQLNYGGTGDKVYGLIVTTPFDPANKGLSYRFAPENADFVGIEDLLRMLQDQRNILWDMMDSSKRKGFSLIEKDMIVMLEKVIISSVEMRQLSSQRKAIEDQYLGISVAANWDEQAADEKGLELFIRAGYDPIEYVNMLSSLGESSAFRGTVPVDLIIDRDSAPVNDATPVVNGASCRIADRGAGEDCLRGDSAHPSDCWRVQDMRNELEKHAADYSKIRAQRPAINVFGERLIRLQSYYFKKNMAEALASMRDVNAK